jgi:hypothetical protein
MATERDELSGDEIVLLIEALDALIPFLKTRPTRLALMSEHAGV